MIHYYLTIYPTEALIASNLDPDTFGSYMATGPKRGAAEQLIFLELTEGGFEAPFDWARAEAACNGSDDDKPKRSAYVSIYRVLEHIPLDKLGSLRLVTRDGRSLAIEAVSGAQADFAVARPYLYQELAPIQPLVVSSLNPQQFGAFMTDGDDKPVQVPSLAFAEMKLPPLEDLTNTGRVHYSNVGHLSFCVEALSEAKPSKTVDRMEIGNFAFSNIAAGLYVARNQELVAYPMPSVAELQATEASYQWARSAMIL